MSLQKQRIAPFATGLVIGTIVSLVILFIWYGTRRRTEPIKIEVAPINVLPGSSWRIFLQAKQGWIVEVGDSFVRETRGGVAAEPRALLTSDLQEGVEIGPAAEGEEFQIHLGVLTCQESNRRSCRAESRELNIRPTAGAANEIDFWVGGE